MGTRLKMILSGIMAVFFAFYGYVIWKAAPATSVRYIEWGKTHPFSLLDFIGRAFIGAMFVGVIFIGLSLLEARRFEKSIPPGDEPDGSGGGRQKKLIRLPMSRKVVSIDDWRKTPTDWRIH